MKIITAALMLAISVTALGAQRVAAVEVETDAQKRLGVSVQALAAVETSAQIPAAGRVLDPTMLATLSANLDAADAAVAASTADVERAAKLYKEDGNISLKALQTARAQATADRSALTALQTELRLTWGGAFAEMTAAERRARIGKLVGGSAALVRADPLQGRDGFSPDSALVITATGALIDGTLLGTAPQAANSGLGPGYLIWAETTALPPGLAVRVTLADSTHPVRGVLLPRSAVVRWNGLDWAYVANDATHFERRAVRPVALRQDGWIVGNALRANERAVVAGAEAVLAVDVALPAGGE